MITLQYNQQMQSKAAQILRALNSQIQHQPDPTTQPQPQPQPQLSNEQPPVPTNKQQSQLISQIIENKMPKTIFNTKMKYQQSHQAPECLTEILQKQIGSLLHENICENIESMLKEREKNAYDSFTKGQNEYLVVLFEQVKRKDVSHMDYVNNLMSARLSKVEGDLKHGNLVVNHERNISNRKQFQKLQQLDLARMIKIKDGELRSKMDILHQKMEDFDNISNWHREEPQQLEDEITKKVMQNIDTKSFDLTSERTKIASEYARHMQKQRLSFQKRKKERLARYQQQQKQRQADLKQAQEMRDISRHQQILQRIEMKRKKREEEEKEQQAKDDLARKILAEYRGKLPIFKLKEKQFEQKVLKPQQKFREQKLKEIRQYKKAMSLHEIKQHQSKYLTKLQVEKAKREQQFKLIMKSRRSQQKRKYYRGSAHARIEQMTKEDVIRNYSLREASKLKVHRMKEYSQVIHKQHPPLIDEEKKNELIKLMEKQMMRKKRARKIFKQILDQNTQQIRFEPIYEELPQKDRRLEGNKFFEEAKKHIKRKQKITSVEKIEQLQGSSSASRVKQKVLQNSKAESEKKERSVWEIRSKQLKEIATSEVTDAKNFEYVKLNIENLDNKAAQREDMMKRLELTPEQQMKEKAMMQDYYMESIKHKINLLD